MRAMEAVAAAAAHREPVLLVGDTGSGKTTLVQQIARQVRARAAAAGAHAPAARPASRAGAPAQSYARAATQHAGQRCVARLRSPTRTDILP